MAFLNKEYSYAKHENFDGFLKSVGVPDDKIQFLLSDKPSQKFVKNGDAYTMTTKGLDGGKETTFKSGVEMDDVIGPEKRPINTTFVVDGNTVTQTIKADKGSATFKREFNGDDLVVTITSDAWDGVAKRFYKA